jgi:putative ABC transport system permease protein
MGIVLSNLHIFWWHVARYVRRHRLLSLLNVLSIALGIAVYLAIQIANESATKSFAASVDMVAGKAHLEVRGDVDETIWPVLEKLPSIETITGTVEALATFPDRPGEFLRLVGIDVVSGAEFQTFELTGDAAAMGGLWLSTPGGVAVTRGFADEWKLEIGSRFGAVVNGRTVQLSVVGIVSDGDFPVADSRVAIMDIGWAQELFRSSGRLSSLQVRLREPLRLAQAIAEIQPLTPGLSVGAPRQRSEQMGKMLAAFQLNLSALSMVSLLVAVFLVFNTVSTSVARRRREIGIIRALGVTKTGVRIMYLGEALLYAVPGILIGTAGGVLLAKGLTGAVEQTVSALYTVVNVERLWLSPSQFAVAAFYGIAAALVGAWGPAAEASRVEPVNALRGVAVAVREEISIRRWSMGGIASLGLAASAGFYALAGGPAWMAFVAAFLVLCGFSLLSPLLLPAVRAVFRMVPWLPVKLSAERLCRSMRRNSVTVSALAAAIAMLVALITMVFSFRSSLDAWIGRGIVADYFIAPAANEAFGMTSYLPEESIAWLKARPEIEGVDTFSEKTIDGDFSLAIVDGVYRDNLSFRSGDDRQAMARVFSGEDAVAVTEPYARKHKGDYVELSTPKGIRKFAIAGVYADYSRDRGTVLMSAATHEKWWGKMKPMSAAIYLKPASNGSLMERDFRARFAADGQYSINTSRSLRDRVLKIFDQTFAVTEVLRSVAVVVAIAGVFLTMTALVVERRRELALLRAIGGTAGFVGSIVLSEAALLGLSSAILGIAAGLPLAMVLTWVVNPAFFGWTIGFSIPVWTIFAIPVWLTLVAIAAAWWPARLARKIEIAEALRGE